MQARDFIDKWRSGAAAHGLGERAGAQAHFIDLCRVLGVPEPADPEAYCFERGVAKTGGAGVRTDGFADVWLRGHFAWSQLRRPDNRVSSQRRWPNDASGLMRCTAARCGRWGAPPWDCPPN